MRFLMYFLVPMVFWGVPATNAQEMIIISGAGPSTRIVTEFFRVLDETPLGTQYDFQIPQRSIKHAGGIKACEDNIFGRTGRPLTTQEKGQTKEEIFLGRVPLAFVIDPDLGINHLTLDQLRDILTGKVTNWELVGGPALPVKLVGREPTEAALMALTEELPEISQANFAFRLKKDHQLVQMMNTSDRTGVLGFGALANFPDAQILDVEGLEVGLAVGLVVLKENLDHPLVQAAQELATTKSWQVKVRELGMVPIY